MDCEHSCLSFHRSGTPRSGTGRSVLSPRVPALRERGPGSEREGPSHLKPETMFQCSVFKRQQQDAAGPDFASWVRVFRSCVKEASSPQSTRFQSQCNFKSEVNAIRHNTVLWQRYRTLSGRDRISADYRSPTVLRQKLRTPCLVLTRGTEAGLESRPGKEEFPSALLRLEAAYRLVCDWLRVSAKLIVTK